MLPKLFWLTVPVIEKTFEIQGQRPRICKMFEITGTSYPNNERSEEFLMTECFLNFTLCSWLIYPRPIMIIAFCAVVKVISLLFDFVFNILWGHLKSRYYEKATKFENNVPLGLTKQLFLLNSVKTSTWEIFSNFCWLLRKAEL